MAVTIYRNPCCSTSRMTLELIVESGVAHNFALYLDDTPDRVTIVIVRPPENALSFLS